MERLCAPSNVIVLLHPPSLPAPRGAPLAPPATACTCCKCKMQSGPSPSRLFRQVDIDRLCGQLLQYVHSTRHHLQVEVHLRRSAKPEGERMALHGGSWGKGGLHAAAPHGISEAHLIIYCKARSRLAGCAGFGRLVSSCNAATPQKQPEQKQPAPGCGPKGSHTACPFTGMPLLLVVAACILQGRTGFTSTTACAAAPQAAVAAGGRCAAAGGSPSFARFAHSIAVAARTRLCAAGPPLPHCLCLSQAEQTPCPLR
jgi:hypothetical protein